MTKYQNFANLKWRTAAILKFVFGYISTIYCPINVKFDTQKQNYVQIQVCHAVARHGLNVCVILNA